MEKNKDNEELRAIRLITESSNECLKLISNSLIRMENHMMKIAEHLEESNNDVLNVEKASIQWDIPIDSVKFYGQMDMIPNRKMGKHTMFHKKVIYDWFKQELDKPLSEIRERMMAKEKKSAERKEKNGKLPCSPKVSPKINRSASLAQYYGEHLEEYQWDFFATLTTSYEVSRMRSRSLVNDFFKTVSNRERVSIFWVSEKFPQGEGYHVHALIKFHDKTKLSMNHTKVLRAWSEVTGRNKKKSKIQITKIEPYSADEKGCFYLSHKIKNEGAEYDYFGFEHFPPDTGEKESNKAA